MISAASGAILATIPSPPQGVWYVGPIALRAYAIFIIIGIVVAVWWGNKRFVARGGRPGRVTDISVFAVPFGIIGGRLYHVITDNELYFGEGCNPCNAFAIWNGGLGIWGAIALGAFGAWLGCRYYKIPLTAVADAVAPGIVVAQAIGRLGNYFNQELLGAPSRCTSPATRWGAPGSRCCASTRPTISWACGSTCSPRSSCFSGPAYSCTCGGTFRGRIRRSCGGRTARVARPRPVTPRRRAHCRRTAAQ